MALKVLVFFVACLAMASASAILGLGPWLHGGDDGSYWPGKYDINELHGALPLGLWGGHGLPLAHWG